MEDDTNDQDLESWPILSDTSYTQGDEEGHSVTYICDENTDTRPRG